MDIMWPTSQSHLHYILFMVIVIKFIRYHSCMMFVIKSMGIYNVLVNYDEIII